jgi:hypothetical protein
MAGTASTQQKLEQRKKIGCAPEKSIRRSIAQSDRSIRPDSRALMWGGSPLFFLFLFLFFFSFFLASTILFFAQGMCIT